MSDAVAAAVTHVPAGGGEILAVGENLITVKIDGAATGGAYSCFDELSDPGHGPPPHRHSQEELFYVLEGEVEFIEFRDGAEHGTVCRPGSVVGIAANAVHTFRNAGTTPCRVFFVSVPAGLENYFRAIGQRVADPDHPPPPAAKRDPAEIAAIAAQNGIEIVRPPA